MPKKSQTNNQHVTKKEFKGSMDNIDKRFEQVDKRLEQVDGSINRLAKSIITINDRVDSIEQKMSTKDDVQRIITAIDNLTGMTLDHENKAITNTHRLNEIEPKVEDHEKRIVALESTTKS